MCPPPQGGFQGPAYTQQVPTTVVVHSPAPVLFSTALQDVSGQAMCPHCRQTVLTHIQPTPGLLTWLLFGGLCLFGFCICSCIPFCVESCQDVEHHCPNCRRVIYVYKRMK
uniref:LITAF domain-containing protein n=1 Tax=Knipowitschia caucasica TaxID=637954 RepID=A0AAV2KKA2_KNICA